ncbi:MAG: hypothetical protein VW202_10665 [Halieaceae bacterium]
MMKKSVAFLILSILVLIAKLGTAAASEDRPNWTILIDPNKEDRTIFCVTRSVTSNPAPDDMAGILCMMCDGNQFTGNLLFDRDIAIAGDAQQRVLKDFSPQPVRIFPAEVRSPDGLNDIEVFIEDNDETRAYFVDSRYVLNHIFAADRGKTPLWFRLDHKAQGKRIWQYDVTGAEFVMTRECRL